MAIAVKGLQTHIWNNNLKSGVLLAIYPALIGGVAWGLSALFEFGTNPEATDVSMIAFANNTILQYWHYIVGGVFAWFFIVYFSQTSIMRSICGSRPVTRREEPELYNLLENLSISAGITMPKLEMIEGGELNAFASGIDKSSYTVTVTRGLVKTLGRDELEAVLAHELTHILNGDVRLLMVSTIFTGMFGTIISIVSNLFGDAGDLLKVGSYSRGFGLLGGKRDHGAAGRFVAVALMIYALFWLASTIGRLTQFAISRKREFMADAGAVQLTRNPEAMMSALLRISGGSQAAGLHSEVAAMCIHSTQRFMALFATHPPIEKRIQAISQTTNTAIPHVDAGPAEERLSPEPASFGARAHAMGFAAVNKGNRTNFVPAQTAPIESPSATTQTRAPRPLPLRSSKPIPSGPKTFGRKTA